MAGMAADGAEEGRQALVSGLSSSIRTQWPFHKACRARPLKPYTRSAQFSCRSCGKDGVNPMLIPILHRLSDFCYKVVCVLIYLSIVCFPLLFPLPSSLLLIPHPFFSLFLSLIWKSIPRPVDCYWRLIRKHLLSSGPWKACLSADTVWSSASQRQRKHRPRAVTCLRDGCGLGAVCQGPLQSLQTENPATEAAAPLNQAGLPLCATR